jgi:DNA-binding PadR family transcriptional regulator
VSARQGTDRSQRPAVAPGDLDPVIHERARLAITSVLAARRTVDYLELRALLELTDGNLAAHLRVLERAGYVAVEKSFVARKPRTSYALTPSGRRAFQRHLVRLEQILKQARAPAKGVKPW